MKKIRVYFIFFTSYWKWINTNSVEMVSTLSPFHNSSFELIGSYPLCCPDFLVTYEFFEEI